QPVDLAIHPSGAYLYVSGGQLGLDVYAIDAASGALELIQTWNGAPGPSSCCWALAMHPSGDFLYAVQDASNSLWGFAVAAATGRVTELGAFSSGSAQVFPDEVASLAFAPSGRYLYYRY